MRSLDSEKSQKDYKKSNRWSDQDCESIEFGQSAMSGRISTARRRVLKQNKLRDLAAKHAKTSCSQATQDVRKVQTGHDGRSEITQAYQHDEENRSQHTNYDRIGSTSNEAQDVYSTADSKPQEHENENENENGDNNRKPEESDTEPKQKTVQGEEIDIGILEEYKKRLDSKDNSVFYDMFELIITKLAVMQSSMAQVKNDQKQLNDRVSGLEHIVDVCTQSIDDMDGEINEVQDMNMKLIQSIIKCEDTMSATNKNVSKLAGRFNRGSFIVFGVEPQEEQTIRDAVEDFIKKGLEITEGLSVQSVHKMGKSRNAPIWFKLQDPDDTPTIFLNLKKLKDKKNVKGKSFSVREYVEDDIKEERIRHQDIRAENFRLPMSHRAELSFTRNELIINGEKYEKEIPERKPSNVLLLNGDDERYLNQFKIFEGEPRSYNGSAYQVFAAQVKDIETLKDMYASVAKEHVSATHVMCGFRIFRNQFYVLQDYTDDAEHGAGRCILDALKNAKVWNMAIVVVRYHNGPNIGAKRFEIVSEMAKQAIASFPKVLNYGQYFTDQTSLQLLNAAAEKPKQTETKNARENRGRGTRSKTATTDT